MNFNFNQNYDQLIYMTLNIINELLIILRIFCKQMFGAIKIKITSNYCY